MYNSCFCVKSLLTLKPCDFVSIDVITPDEEMFAPLESDLEEGANSPPDKLVSLIFD